MLEPFHPFKKNQREKSAPPTPSDPAPLTRSEAPSERPSRAPWWGWVVRGAAGFVASIGWMAMFPLVHRMVVVFNGRFMVVELGGYDHGWLWWLIMVVHVHSSLMKSF